MDYLIGITILGFILFYLIVKMIAVSLFSADIVMQEVERNHASRALDHAERRRL